MGYERCATLPLKIDYFDEQVRRHTHTIPIVSEINPISVTWNHWKMHCLKYVEGHIMNLFSVGNLHDLSWDSCVLIQHLQ